MVTLCDLRGMVNEDDLSLLFFFFFFFFFFFVSMPYVAVTKGRNEDVKCRYFITSRSMSK